MRITDKRAAEIRARVVASFATGEWQMRAFRRPGFCACIETAKGWGPSGLDRTIAHLERDEDALLLLSARDDLRDLLDDRQELLDLQTDRRELLDRIAALEDECKRLRRSIR